MTRTEIAYVLLAFVLSCSLSAGLLPLFSRICRRAGLGRVGRKLNGLPMLLAMFLTEIVLFVVAPNACKIINIPLELLAGFLVIVFLGFACDIDKFSLSTRIVVLLLGSLAFPVARVCPHGFMGACLVIGMVMAVCLGLAAVVRDGVFGAVLLLLLVVTLALISLARGNSSLLMGLGIQAGAIMGFVIYCVCQRANKGQRVVLGECGSMAMGYVFCTHCMMLLSGV